MKSEHNKTRVDSRNFALSANHELNEKGGE